MMLSTIRTIGSARVVNAAASNRSRQWQESSRGAQWDGRLSGYDRRYSILRAPSHWRAWGIDDQVQSQSLAKTLSPCSSNTGGTRYSIEEAAFGYASSVSPFDSKE